MEKFIFNKLPKTYFGENSLSNALNTEMPNIGNTVMITYGGGSIKKNGILDEAKEILEKSGKRIIEFNGIMSNPTYKKVLEGASVAKENNVDFILAIGGGSVIDCSKIISAAACSEEDIWTMEFEQKKYPSEFITMASVVTASGTGAEMNNGAVITNEDKKIKAGVLGALSEFVVLDPTYTLSVPTPQVISGAFDTLSHCMETYFGSPLKNNVSDEINEAIMRNTIRNIREVIQNPKDTYVRSELMWDSSLAETGLLKLGKVTDFQCHQIEHQLGAYTDCNHGQGLAVIHPILYKHIYKDGLEKFVRFAQAVWNVETEGKIEEEIALAGINALADFIKEIGLPTTFKEMNISDEAMLKNVADSSNITAGCCKKLTKEEIFEILKECM